MKCQLCNNLVHLKCLPNVDKNDSIYVLRESTTWFCTLCIEQALPYNHIHDDDEYLCALSENWDLPESISFEMLKHQHELFLPLDLNENFDSPLAEMDPDIHYSPVD